MTNAYRSAYDHIVGTRLAETRVAAERIQPLLPDLRRIERSRIARIAAGGAGVLCALGMVVTAAAGRGEEATWVLLGSWAAMAGTWVAATIGTRTLMRDPGASELALSGDLDTDLGLIEQNDPQRKLRNLQGSLDRLEVASTSLPLVAITFLTPLLLHFLFIELFGRESWKNFADWIRISLIVVGHAHIALIVLAARFTLKMKRSTFEDLGRMNIHREWAKAWGITIGVSCVPGIVLLLVPPLLVAITGLAIIPLMWMLTRNKLIAERATMEFAETAAKIRVEPFANEAFPAPIESDDAIEIARSAAVSSLSA